MPINFSSKKTYIRKIIIKENQSHFFFIGTYNIKKSISYLQIKKLKFKKNNYEEYSTYKLKDILDEYDLDSANSNVYFEEQLDAKNFPLKSLKEINCLFGFIKFSMGYYAIFSCDSEIVGKIARNIIFRVNRLIYFPLFDVDDEIKQSSEFLYESKYIALVTSVNYDKQIYFSYSYDLSKTLQRNYVESFKKEMIPGFETNAYISSKKFPNSKNSSNSINKNNINNEKINLSMKKCTNYYFCWNYFHIKEFFNIIKNKAWINFFIYGYFGQSICNFKGLRLLISVVARRNRHYAGVRYQKRGISEDGNVANDVESEQILEEINTTWSDRPKISSFIQIRGSIPIYWYQNQSFFNPKPLINVNLSDIRFEATKRHFAILIERYGHPCIVFNLTKKIEDGRPQETLLNEWYYNGVNYINNNIDDHLEKIIYYHYDLKNKRNEDSFYKQFFDISVQLIDKTNLFLFMPILKNKYHISLQNGVVRTNCIDCIDRTNVFQQILGIAVMVIQLRHMGINEQFPENENEGIYGVLKELYIKLGHELANQYTGSLALKQTITDHRNIIDKMLDSFYEVFISVKRIFINYFNDQWKQNSINLFLGKYPINTGLPFIWDMPCDEILHKKKNLKQLSKYLYTENYNKYITFNLFMDIDNRTKLINNGKVINIVKSEGKSKNKKGKIKMSTTSLLMYRELYPKIESSIIHRENSDSSIEVKRTRNNKILNNFISAFNTAIININEYILDYNSYIEFKSKKRNKDEEEKAFEDDSIMQYILEVKSQDIRDFNNFEYYPINFIKKNGINNDSSEQNSNNNDIPYINSKHYIHQLRHIKTNVINVRKNSNFKFKTPIKGKITKVINSQCINEPQRLKRLKDKHGIFFIHYNTPFVPPLTSNFNSKFCPNIQYCPNPRNVVELKKEMIKLNSSSFQLNDEDYNKINNFTQPIDKRIKKTDLYELDPFITCDLENTDGIFEIHKHIEKDIIDFDPLQNIFLEEQKKEEIDNEDEDYIIFDVKKRVLFKQCHHDIQKKTNLMPIKDFFPEIGQGNKEEKKHEENNCEDNKLNIEKEGINKDEKSKSKIITEEENIIDSPKIKIVKIKKLPLKIENDYFKLK